MGTLLRADHGEYRRPFIPDPLLAQRLLQLPRCSSPAKDIVRGAFLDRKGGSRVWTALWLRGGRCAILFPEPDRSSLRRFTGIKWWSPRTAALYGLSVSFVSQIFLLEQIKDPRGALEAVLPVYGPLVSYVPDGDNSDRTNPAPRESGPVGQLPQCDHWHRNLRRPCVWTTGRSKLENPGSRCLSPLSTK